MEIRGQSGESVRRGIEARNVQCCVLCAVKLWKLDNILVISVVWQHQVQKYLIFTNFNTIYILVAVLPRRERQRDWWWAEQQSIILPGESLAAVPEGRGSNLHLDQGSAAPQGRGVRRLTCRQGSTPPAPSWIWVGGTAASTSPVSEPPLHPLTQSLY